jgi:glycosyltransferase involved in cell wall biosynthesis
MGRKKRILILSPSPEGVNPGQRLKYEQYYNYLRENGYELTLSSFQTMRFWNIIYKPGRFFEKVFWTLFGYAKRVFDILRAPFYDGVYIFLWVTPFGTPLYEWLLHKMNSKIIFDLDDMVFLGHSSEANKLIAPLKGKSKMLYLMKVAKHVIICTPKLEEIARQYNDRVTDISSTFDTDRFVPVESYEQKEVTTIGWTGSHSTLKYLHLLDEVIQEVAKQRKIKLRVIADKEFELEGVEVEYIPWTSENEVKDLHGIDIGVYPLPIEDWVLGKSGCKTITYMSIAIPSVSTAYCTIFRVVEDEKEGLLVKEKQEWVDAIIRLIDDPALRERIGKAGREKVVGHFSVYANRDKYLDAYKEVYGEPGK